MSLHLSGSNTAPGGRGVLEIGLVNNMPDSALKRTEQQFTSLLEEASDGMDVRLSLYALSGVPRSEDGLRQISSYGSIRDIESAQPDAIIVTGAEPRADRLNGEPYWRDLARLIDWAWENTSSAIWSCLAAHAAVLRLDGIERQRVPEKRFGVFSCERVVSHVLTHGARRAVQMPHSRWNDLPESALWECGYAILTRSANIGADAFVKAGPSLFVLFQGHPEYGPEVLLKEYRRDVKRFLRKERDTYPGMPSGYFDETTASEWAAVEAKARSIRSEEVVESFPIVQDEETATSPWHPDAVCIYRNWLSYLAAARRCGEAERSTTASVKE